MKIKNAFGYAKDYIRIKCGLETPLSLVVFISDRCNLKCRFCFWWKADRKPQEMSLEKYEKIAKSLVYPLKNLHITGGEPFFRDDIVDIVKTFVLNNKTESVTISTNGTLTDIILKRCLEMKKFVPKLDIFLSLDGFEKTHDWIRGVKGTFKKAYKTVELLTKNGINVHICATLTNETDEDELLKLSEHTVKKLNLPFYGDIVRGNPRIPYIKPPIFNKKFLKLHDEKKYAFGNYMMKRKFDIIDRKFKFNCVAGNFAGVIYSNGDISICELVKPFGNLKETNFNFRKLWKKRPKVPKGCACTEGCFMSPSLYYSLHYIKNRKFRAR